MGGGVTSTKGIASFNSSDFTVSSGVVSLASSGAAFSTTFGAVGSVAFLQTRSISLGQGVAVGSTVSGSKLFYGASPGSITKSHLEIASGGTLQGGNSGIYTSSGNGGQAVGGTWRNMGPGVADYAASAEYLNLWVRVS